MAQTGRVQQKIVWTTHLIADCSDIPTVPCTERRRTPDRRTHWRGGRRNSDWLQRPAGALDALSARQSRRWRQIVAFLHPFL
jgi:hypothetical protein